MTQIYYFTYGSNMLVERLRERCPSTKFVCPAYVCGYDLCFSKRSKDCSGKVTIIENGGNNDKLYGALFRIDKAEHPTLDKAEGLGYERADDFVVVKVDDDQEIEVTTYFAKPGATGEQLKPYSWYKQLILWGAIHAKLPSSYLAKLVAIEADRDLDNQRNEKALNLLKKINSELFSEGNWDMKIADQYTVADWNAMKSTLVPGKPDNWEEAFNLFFQTRIETRYFEPIKLLQKHGKNKGEGFSIVALQCSLIEFLSSVADTKNCTCEKPSPSKTKCKCCKKETDDKICQTCKRNIISSSKRFTDFLRNNSLFKGELSTCSKANSFYDDVRCALLHNARTKGNWIILADSEDDEIISWNKKNEKILYRNNLQKAFDQYVDSYGKELKKCPELQKAFIRKFDSLCEE